VPEQETDDESATCTHTSANLPLQQAGGGNGNGGSVIGGMGYDRGDGNAAGAHATVEDGEMVQGRAQLVIVKGFQTCTGFWHQ